MKITIAIADDHPLVITGLKHILGNSPDMEIIASYANGKELLTGLEQRRPDVLLLDIQMPGQTGDELAEIIRAQYPSVKMIALTNLDNIFYIKNMLRKGVNGYILKTTREEILLNAIRTVNEGQQYVEPVLKEKLADDIIQAKRQSVADMVLSHRERDVLQLIASDLTSQQIAEALNLSKRTVDNHRLSLLVKLDVKNVAAMVKKGIQLGLID